MKYNEQESKREGNTVSKRRRGEGREGRKDERGREGGREGGREEGREGRTYLCDQHPRRSASHFETFSQVSIGHFLVPECRRGAA